MRTWLKRMVAGIVSAGTLMGSGLLMAGTANADEIRMPDIGKTITSLTASAATTYPRELVNGDFEYPSMKSLQHYFTGIDRNRSQWISNGQGDDLAKWSDIPGGLDTTRFGWSSTQTQGAMSEQRANAVELQKATGETTQMGELCASQKGTAIYQDIATTPGTLYRIELDHASRYSIHLDQMQVMVGAPGHERPVEMTRTSSNKYGDKIGEKSTTIATHSTNPFGNQSSKDDFSHYVGYYTIPAGQSVTRFTFRQVSGVNTTSGNLLDNIVFTQAYKLDYDRNSDEATGQTPNDTATVKPAKTSATGGVKTVADENVRYGSLANGDFSYPSFSDIQENEQGTYADLRTFLKSDDGTLWYNMSTTDLSKYGKIGQIPGFDSSRFAWSSTENGSRVELQQDRNTKNTYAEIVAQQDNTSIYQNVSTGNGGVLYKIRLKHASRQSSHADKMQVLVGSDTAHATPVEMTRVTSNGHGDKVGGKSTTITTKVSNTDPRDHGSQWETYEGYYQVPEGQKNTVFMFKSLEGFKDVETLPGNNVGNLVDDIEFSRSYKLTYDKNASDATGKVPSNQRGKENTVQPAESKTTGNVKTVADNTSNLPDHLVNGTFDYRGNEIINENQRVYGSHDTTYLAMISAKTGIIGNPLHSKLDNWNSGKFGWKSNDDTAGADTVEVQRRNHTPYPTNAGNVWGEIAAAKRGKYIYQDIATTPGVVYKWSLKHASRNADQDDSMQVMIGEPGKTVAQQATRTTSNGSDKTGSVGTTITTHGTAQDGNITGIGGNTHSQLFTENANGIGSDAGRIMDVDAYLADLTAYRDSLTGADAAYQTALAKSEQAAQDASDAAKALAAAQQAARKAAEEAQQAAQKARDLQAAADEAQKAYDEAVKANEDKAKALEEAKKDQTAKNEAYSAAQQATKEARSEADAATDAQTAAQTAVDKANTAVTAAQAKIDTADKLTQTAAKNKTDAEAAIKQANTDKTKAEADLADAKAAKAEAEKAKQAALEAKTVSDAKVEAADKQVKAADEAIADAKAAYAKAKDDLNTATGKLNDARNTIKRLQNAEENLKKANAKLADAQAKLDEANKAKDEADKAYEKAKADYDAKLADKQASDKELAAAKQAEAEAKKQAEEEARKQQAAQQKADQAKKDAEAKKQKAEQAKKQAAGVTNNGLASTGSDTTAIATLAAIMTIAGAGCVLVRVRSAKHADGWHAVED